MKEKILNIIHKKLCEGFNTTFIPLTQFEKEFAEQEAPILASLKTLTQTYFQLKDSESLDVVKIKKGDYIIEQLNKHNNRNTPNYTIKDLEELKQKFEDKIENLEDDYDSYITKGNEDYILPLISFIKDKTVHYISSCENNKTLSISSLFWDYFHNKYEEKGRLSPIQTKEIINEPDLIIKNFKENYLSNTYLNLLDLADKTISDETLSAFDQYIINVGKRHCVGGHSGWSTTTFQIMNNSKEYNFSYSVKDEKRIQGDCINIFIFQTKYLIKISITLEEVERTPYIIHRDCEKISLKNECELVIVKHHGNETIVFDTRKDALAFQTKLIEIREGRKNK